VYTDSGQRVFGAEDRLKALKSQLASFKARYAPGHPDIVNTQREVDGLEKELDAEDSTSDRLRQLSEAKAQLASALEKYTEDHPDVMRLQRQVANLQKAVDGEAAAGIKQIERKHADNPVYVQVKGQLDALSVDRENAVKKRDELQSKFDEYERRLAKSPEVERAYRTMARDLESAQLKYQEVLSKQSEVQVSQNLETERKGEKFTLIEPPQIPEKPISPNRWMILILGVVAGLGVGAGAVVLRESLDASIRGPGDIRQLLQVPALASIPLIVTDADRTRHKRLLRLSWAGGAATLVLSLATVHFFVRPLDVVWVSLIRRFGG
jgi:uncharacterized protein involved in exopolysaccharide biosynthesis